MAVADQIDINLSDSEDDLELPATNQEQIQPKKANPFSAPKEENKQ